MRIPLDVEQMVRQFFMNLARDRILFLYKTASAATCAVGTIKCIGVDSYQFTEYSKYSLDFSRSYYFSHDP